MTDFTVDEIDEALGLSNENNTEPKTDLPEAPASVSVKAWYRGYGVMFTMRHDNANALLDRTTRFIDYVESKGWKNVWDEKPVTLPTTVVKTDTSISEVPTCGVHGTPMSWKTGSYKETTAYHKAGDQYAFWSCPAKNADGSYCKFKPKK